MSYCQVGDFPAVYYKFSGQLDWQNVKLGFSPIDIQVEPISNDSDGDGNDGDGSDGDGSDGGRIPCPPEGTLCRLRATGYAYLADIDESLDREDYPSYYFDWHNQGWGIRAYFDSQTVNPNDPSRNDDGEQFIWFKFRLVAGTYYYFVRGQPRPLLPDLEEYFGSGNFEELSFGDDSCFPNGGDPLNCSTEDDNNNDDDGDGNGEKPKKGNQDLVRLKVLYNNQVIWQATGKNPANYSVTCDKDKCPPDFLKLSASNPQGFCCIPCEEMKNEISQIKALLRRNNG